MLCGKSLVSIAPRLPQYAASVRALRNVTGQCKTLISAFTVSLQIEPLIPASVEIDVGVGQIIQQHSAECGRGANNATANGGSSRVTRVTWVGPHKLMKAASNRRHREFPRTLGERSRSDRHHYGAQQLRCAALLGRSGLHLACVCRLREAASHNVSSCSKRPRLWNFNFAEVACRIAQPQQPLP